jgi:MFS family permease
VSRSLPHLDADAYAQRVSRYLVMWISLLLITGVAAYGLFIVRDFNLALEPELERRANLIGGTIHDDIGRALEVGIPLTEFAGVDAYLASFLEEFPELDYLAVRNNRGELLYAGGATPPQARSDTSDRRGQQRLDVVEIGDSYVYRFLIGTEGAMVGSIEVGVDRFFVRSKLQDLALDVVVILIVTLVVAFEVMLTISQRIIGRRSRRQEHESRQQTVQSGSVGDIRLVLFLFAVGEELNKSFLPLFIKAADNPVPWLDVNVAISLPIVAYLLTVALASLLAGRLVTLFGQRGLFLVRLVPAALSHLGMIFADNVLEIIGLRALTGIGYGLATIACQEYLLDRLSQGSRTGTIGVFISVIIGGTFAGTALGGIFADRLGYQAVFMISFALVVASGLLSLGMMQRGSGSASQGPDTFSVRDIVSVLRRPSLLLLLGGVTIPMNVLMAGFLWYLVPLTMADVGATTSAIARTLMVYYLVILIGGPLLGSLADRRFGRWALVGTGSVLSGAVLFLPALMPLALTISLGVLAVGIGHAAVRGPQIALALDIADAEAPAGGRGAILAAMRSLERLGSLIGLLAVGLLAARFGLVVAIGAIGVGTAGAAIVFLFARPFLTPSSSRIG